MLSLESKYFMIHIDQPIGASILPITAKTLLKNLIFRLHRDLMVIEPIPLESALIKYKSIVMSSLRVSIVHQYSMQVVRILLHWSIHRIYLLINIQKLLFQIFDLLSCRLLVFVNETHCLFEFLRLYAKFA